MRALETFVQDFRYALRSLLRAPLLSSVCIITLALGIALNATVFTIVSGIVFRARVDKEPERFVHLSPVYREPTTFHGKAWSISTEDYRVYAQRSRAIHELAAWDNVRVTVGSEEGDSVLGLLVTCNFFSVYGLERTAKGRLFSEDECSRSGSAPVVILSEEIWRERFDADPEIIGKTAKLNRVPFVIVGIAPAGFAGRVRGPGIWMPWAAQPMFYQGQDFFKEPVRWLTVEGRLKPGFSRAEAQAELAVLAAQQDRLHPGRLTTMSLTNGSLAEEPSLRGEIFWISPVIMGGLTLVLLVACTNVTVLQLSRAVSRKREVAIRLSLGAGSFRLVRMLVTESLVLAAAAGLAGAFVVYQAPLVFAKILASSSTPVYQTRPDASTLVYLAVIVFTAACIAGISPAAEWLRVDLASSMKTGGAEASRSRGGWYRNALVACQVGMTFVLLATAGFFIRARDAVFNGNPGFETDRVLLMPLDLRAAEVATLANRVRSIPGVRGVASGSPMNQGELGSGLDGIRLPGQERRTGRPAGVSLVSAEYFQVLSIPIVRGRDFSKPDEVRGGVCVVSEQFARAFWPGSDAVGKRILLPDDTSLEVAGVVRDVSSERMGQIDGPHVYRLAAPAAQTGPMLIRFAGDERQILSSIRSDVAAFDPALIAVPKTLRTIRNDMASRSGTLIGLISGLAGLAMLLAAAGLYGVVDFTMRRRTKELGIRMALGASRAAIVRRALLSGARPVVFGLIAGTAAAAAGGRILANVLRHTPIALHPADTAVYIATALLLGGTALVAMVRPVWRAAISDPMKALREE